MAGWLEKVRALPAIIQKSANLPAEVVKPNQAPPPALPNATIIYGIGAALLFVAAFFLLISWRLVSALAVLALGACLTGFALHFLKHQD